MCSSLWFESYEQVNEGKIIYGIFFNHKEQNEVAFKNGDGTKDMLLRKISNSEQPTHIPVTYRI